MSRRNALRLVLALIVAIPSILGGYFGSTLFAVIGGVIGLGLVLGYALANAAANADRQADELGRRLAITAEHAQRTASSLSEVGTVFQRAGATVSEAVEGLRTLARVGINLRTRREGALLVAEGKAAVPLGSAHDRALLDAYERGALVKTAIPRLFGRTNQDVELAVTGYVTDPELPGHRTYTLRTTREAVEGAQEDAVALEADAEDLGAPEALRGDESALPDLAFDFDSPEGTVVPVRPPPEDASEEGDGS